MKMRLFFAVIVIVFIAAGCNNTGMTGNESDIPNQQTESSAIMEMVSSGIANGIIDPAYGANGTDIIGGVPVLSMPIEISGAPADAACFALYMDDLDSEPLCGYKWVHWMAANITVNSIPEDFSREPGDGVVQGQNDFGTIGYGGPTPPDKDHRYQITVYALDSKLSLSEGFTKEDFIEAVEGHAKAVTTLEAIYKK